MSRIASAFVEISTRQQKFDAELAQAKGKTSAFLGEVRGKFAEGGRSIFGGILGGLGIGAGFAAFTGIENAIEAVVHAAGHAEESQAKLRATLRATGNEVPQNAARINEMAERLAHVANVSPETTRTLAALGLNLGIGAGNIDAYVKAAIGLAEATGGDATESMEKLIKASQGGFTALQKQLPILKTLQTNEEKLAYIQKIARQGLQERAAQLDTVRGSTEALRLAQEELYISAGRALGPGLIAFAREATTAMRALTRGTLENAVAFLELEKTLLRIRDAMASTTVFGLFTHSQKQIEEIDKQIDSLTKKAVEDENKKSAAAGDTKDKLMTQAMAAEKLRGSLHDAADIWKKAQEDALKGGAGGIGAGAAGGKGMGGDGLGPPDTWGIRHPLQNPGSLWNGIVAAIATMRGQAASGSQRNESATDESARLKSEREQLSGGGLTPDAKTQAIIDKLSERITVLMNQIKSEGGPASGQAHRDLEHLKDKLGDAVRAERPGGLTESDAAKILRDREKPLEPLLRAVKTTLDLININIQKINTGLK